MAMNTEKRRDLPGGLGQFVLIGEQMQAQLASALDEGRRHLVSVRERPNGQLEIEFAPELGEVGGAFVEASKRAPNNRPS